jgi:hypothetical protein
MRMRSSDEPRGVGNRIPDLGFLLTDTLFLVYLLPMRPLTFGTEVRG